MDFAHATDDSCSIQTNKVVRTNACLSVATEKVRRV